jgi:signal peptidase II
MDRIWKNLIMVTFLILADQFTKGYIEQNYYLGESIPVIKDLFNFTYIRNTGVAFGIGADATELWRRILFLLLPVLACFYLVYLIWVSRKKTTYLGVAYSLILAGAIGNLIDRFSLGYVVDFLDFFWGRSHFPAFNVADSCITVAAGILILDSFIKGKEKPVDGSERLVE